MLDYQRVNPIKSHETTIFLWVSYGFLVAYTNWKGLPHMAGWFFRNCHTLSPAPVSQIGPIDLREWSPIIHREFHQEEFEMCHGIWWWFHAAFMGFDDFLVEIPWHMFDICLKCDFLVRNMSWDLMVISYPQYVWNSSSDKVCPRIELPTPETYHVSRGQTSSKQSGWRFTTGLGRCSLLCSVALFRWLNSMVIVFMGFMHQLIAVHHIIH